MKSTFFSLFICTASLLILTACAEIKDSGRTIGHAAKDVTTTIGHATRDTAKSIGENTKDVVNDVKNSVAE